MEKHLLIAGFGASDGSDGNPSWQAVKRLPDTVGCFRLEKCAIPTIFGTAAQMILERAKDLRPDLILCVGVAPERDAVTPERIAVNIRDAHAADEAGNQPAGEFVVFDGPAAYFATVPVERMAQAIRARGIPARVSNTAGAFVCNDVFYTVLHRCASTDIQVGFIHVPALADNSRPSLMPEQLVTALTAAIEACG